MSQITYQDFKKHPIKEFFKKLLQKTKKLLKDRNALIKILATLVILALVASLYLFLTRDSEAPKGLAELEEFTRTSKIMEANSISSEVSVQASSYVESKDLTALNELYEVAIAKNASNISAVVALKAGYANYLMMLGEPEKALSVAREAYGQDSERLHESELLYTISYTAYQMKNMETAREYFQKYYEYMLDHQDKFEPGVVNETKEFIEKLGSEK